MLGIVVIALLAIAGEDLCGAVYTSCMEVPQEQSLACWADVSPRIAACEGAYNSAQNSCHAEWQRCTLWTTVPIARCLTGPVARGVWCTDYYDPWAMGGQEIVEDHVAKISYVAAGGLRLSWCDAGLPLHCEHYDRDFDMDIDLQDVAFWFAEL